MNNDRINNRYSSYAKILMDGLPGYMRDISSDGFKYVTILPMTVLKGDVKQITIIPQDTSFDSFQLSGEIRWIKEESEGFQVCGIRITEFKSDQYKNSYKELQNRFSS
ncbi:MAG: hypothetical protein B6241_06010 [Spirochaetaceae bacterium 4572_59]|nr:MAG: hypothetical protein B6241_06010 [Spirochaetaceae bacterium 4572_59]